MKCEACLSLIDDYAEDEVEESVADDLAAHLAGCGACAKTFETMRLTQNAYTHYFLVAEPPPRLWANLSMRIAQEKTVKSPSVSARFLKLSIDGFRSLRAHPLQAARYAFAAIVITVGLLGYFAPGKGTRFAKSGVQTSPVSSLNSSSNSSDNAKEVARDSRPEKAVASKTVGDRPLPSKVLNKYAIGEMKDWDNQTVLKGAVSKAEQRYLEAIAVLARDISRRRKPSDTRAIAALNQALAEIDRTISDTRKAVCQRPNDPLAVMYMSIAYEKKVEVYRQLMGS